MSTQTLTSIVEQLVAEERRLNQEAEQLRTQLKATDQELTKVRKAAASLGRSTSDSPTKPTATMAEVTKLITQKLQDSPEICETDLKDWVDSALAESGKSRTGLAMRFRRAMKEVTKSSKDKSL